MLIYKKNNIILATHSNSQAEKTDSLYDYDEKIVVDDRTIVNFENQTYSEPTYDSGNQIHVERLRKDRIQKLSYYLDEEIKLYGGSSLDKKLNNIIKALSLTRKEAKSSITQDELTLLDNLSLVQTYIEDLRIFESEQLALIEVMIFSELVAYNPLNSTWPTRPILA